VPLIEQNGATPAQTAPEVFVVTRTGIGRARSGLPAAGRWGRLTLALGRKSPPNWGSTDRAIVVICRP